MSVEILEPEFNPVSYTERDLVRSSTFGKNKVDKFLLYCRDYFEQRVDVIQETTKVYAIGFSASLLFDEPIYRKIFVCGASLFGAISSNESINKIPAVLASLWVLALESLNQNNPTFSDVFSYRTYGQFCNSMINTWYLASALSCGLIFKRAFEQTNAKYALLERYFDRDAGNNRRLNNVYLLEDFHNHKPTAGSVALIDMVSILYLAPNKMECLAASIASFLFGKYFI